MTAEEFEAAYAALYGVTVAWLHANGRYAEPCYCSGEMCEGWLMGHQWEDAIVEDELRSSEPGEPELKVTKLASYIMVSDEILMDEGIIPDTRPPPPPIPWRRRLHWRWQEARERAAALAYRAIAGAWPPSDDD